MKKLLLTFSVAALLQTTSMAQINLMKDVNAGTSGSSPTSLVDVNGTLFYGTYITSQDIWKSDGTPSGTTLVKNLEPGSTYGFPVSFNNALYFLDVPTGSLWKSDGTTAGTVVVKTVGTLSGKITVFNNNMYFIASGKAGSGLYKSDGTGIGTVFVKSGINTLTVSGSHMYFVGVDVASGTELWKTDGTAGGTALVKDIVAGTGNGVPNHLTDVNGTIYFTANDGVNGNELWKSDGTAGGTVLVKDVTAGASSSSLDYFTNVNGTLYFTKGTDALWKSDGTSAGTVQIKLGGFDNVKDLINVNGTLFFGASDIPNGFELWKSDGTLAGTTIVKDINPGSSGSGLLEYYVVGSTLYFSASDFSTNGRELWKSDGTSAGTVLIQDKNTGSASFTPKLITKSGDNLFMVGKTATEGEEVFAISNVTTGVSENVNSANDFSIYPNPNTGAFTLELNNMEQNTSVKIYNLIGETVYEQEVSSSKIQLTPNLNSGIYFVNVIDGKGNRSIQKLITK